MQFAKCMTEWIATVENPSRSLPLKSELVTVVSPSKQKVERPGSPRRSVRVERTIQNPGKPKKVDQEVVVDKNLITSRSPEDLPAFSAAIVSQLAGTTTKEEEKS